MQLNNQLLQLLGLRFADANFDIDFDDYLTCIVRLENMFRKSLGDGGPSSLYSDPVGWLGGETYCIL